MDNDTFWIILCMVNAMCRLNVIESDRRILMFNKINDWCKENKPR